MTTRKSIIVALTLAAAGMLILHVLLPSCVHPIRGTVAVCGDGIYIKVADAPNAPRQCIPSWWISILLAIYPAITLIHAPLRETRRQRLGLCTQCGYNLKGNTSGTCPECSQRID